MTGKFGEYGEEDDGVCIGRWAWCPSLINIKKMVQLYVEIAYL